jgi:hypothetical protein
MYSARRVFLLLLSLGISIPLLAQTDTARLTGTVTDPNGAVVAGATITVTNLGTQREVTVQSDPVGNYVVAALPPGQYQVELKQTGFRTVTQRITLQTQQVAALNFQLQVGQVTENVTVTTDVPLVESASSNISSVVVGRQITELPLNGRNFTQLATLVPGVTRGLPGGQGTGAGNQAETFRYNNTGGASLSVNGLRPQNNNFLLDGIDNNESLVNTIIFFPPAEAIDEFRVDTSVAPAEFGRAGGGVVNTRFKSGTNEIHGSAFYFMRNDNLDAKPFFVRTPKSEFKRHQFGGSIGGPIIKNKLFVFGDYQGLRQYLPLAQDRATVPTDLMREGDFTELLALSTPIVIKNPTTGMPFTTPNVIDPGLIIAPGQNYLKAYPEPNVTGNNPLCGQVNTNGVCIKQNYVTQRKNIQNFDDFDVRVDWNIRSQDTLFGRFSYGRDKEDTTSRLPALPAGFGSGIQANYPKSFALGETHTFGTSVINEFRFGWIKTTFGFTPPFENVPISANLGIPNANTSPLLGGGALIGGFNDQLEFTGDFGLYNVPEQTWQVSDSVSWVKGNHTFKFGTTILRRQVNLFRPFAGKGFFNLFGNGQSPSPTGYEVSDILAGFVNNYQVGPDLGYSHTRNWETGYYAQDDWRITRRLTLNLGVRYDLYTWPLETHNLQANFDPTAGCLAHPLTVCTTGHLLIAGQNGASQSLIPTDTNNFAPRIGFAYDVMGDGKTVLRGGFGIFYFLDRGGIDNQLAQNPPFAGKKQFNYTDGFRINLLGRAPDGSNDPTLAGTLPMPSKGPINVNPLVNVNLISYPQSDRNSYAEQWNLQVQRELGANTALSVGYVGVHGVDLMTLFNLNRQFYDAAPGARQFAQLGDVNTNITKGGSSYNSLQAQLTRRLSQGIQFNGSYTWSHTIDDSPGTLDRLPNNSQDHFDYFNWKAERGNSNLDVPHRVVLNALLELPFGHGKRWGSSFNGTEQAVLGGWQVSPIFIYQSGLPFDPWDGSQSPNTRPDLVGHLHTLGRVKEWFDTSAFVDPPIVSFPGGKTFARPGTSPRNPLFGPSRKYMDLSISKNFHLYERLNTEFRAEFYNLTNTPQFDQPVTQFNSGQFGQITNTLLNSERQIEFALRFSF